MDRRGKIVLVGTPIGNIGDITKRALDALSTCDAVYCEDTRVTGSLLKLLDISAPLFRMDENTIAEKIDDVLDEVERGQTICYCSDAGLPGISDPGSRIVSAARDRSITVEILPGACALTTAFVGAGLKTGEFKFIGFLPKKSKEKTEKLESAMNNSGATVLYESPNRIVDTLSVITDIDESRKVCVARELTKLHEEVLVDSAKALFQEFSSRKEKSRVKGEFVVVIDEQTSDKASVTKDKNYEIMSSFAELQLSRGISSKDVANDLKTYFSCKRNEAYEIVQNCKTDISS